MTTSMPHLGTQRYNSVIWHRARGCLRLNLMHRLIAILGLAVLLGGCALYEDIDLIEFQAADQDINDAGADMTSDMMTSDMTTDMPSDMNPADMADMSDMSDMTDMTVSDMTDMADMVDMADMNMADMTDMSIPVGGVCPETPGTITGTCDPVLQDCPANAFCAVNLQLVMGTPQFDLLCFLKDGDETQVEGEACGMAGTCEPGLTCVNQFCRRICWKDTGQGCMANEFCREFSGVPGVGYCAPACP